VTGAPNRRASLGAIGRTSPAPVEKRP